MLAAFIHGRQSMTPAQVAQETTETASRFFNLPDRGGR